MPEFRPLLNSTGRTWKCGHPRRGGLAKETWAKLMLAVQEGRLSKATAGHEMLERQRRCPGCSYDDRRRRKYIAGHIALLLIQVVLGCLWAAEAAR